MVRVNKNREINSKAKSFYFVYGALLALIFIIFAASTYSSIQNVSKIKTKTAIAFAQSFADLFLRSDTSQIAQNRRLISFNLGNFDYLNNQLNGNNIQVDLLKKLKGNHETNSAYRFYQDKGEEKFLYISKVANHKQNNHIDSKANNNRVEQSYIVVSFPSNVLNISDYQSHLAVIWRIHLIVIVLLLFLWIIGLVFEMKRVKSYKELSKKLAENEKYSKELMMFSPTAIFIGDAEGKLIDVNDAALELTEYSKEELYEMKLDNLFPNEVLQKKPLQYKDVLAGKTVSNERVLQTKSGKKICVHMFSKKLPSGVLLSSMVDVTKESDYTENILQVNNMLEQAEELSRSASGMIIPQTNQIMSSKGFNQLLGFDTETEMTLEIGMKAIGKKNFDYIISKRSKLKNPGDSFSFEHKLTKVTGEVIWVLHTEKLYLNNITGEKYIVTSMWDITEQKRINDYLAENEKLFRTIFELAQVGLMIIDAEYAINKIADIFGNTPSDDDIVNLTDEQITNLLNHSAIIKLNNNAKKILGVSELKGITLGLFLDKHDYPKIRNIYKAIFNQLHSVEIELSVKNLKTNEYRLGLCSIALPQKNNEKSIIVSWTDITEINNIRKELSQNLALAQAYFNESPLFIMTTDVNGRITMMNRFARNLLKIKSDDILGNYFYDLISNKRAKETIIKIFNKIIKREKFNNNPLYFKFNVDGNIITVNWKFALLNDYHDEVNGLLIVGNDITSEQRNNEELKFTYREIIELKRKLEQNNKALHRKENELQQEIFDKNRFFSIIAHDVKSPFSALLGLSGLLAESVDFFSTEEIKEMATGINRQANNIFELLESLLQWSRSQMDKIPFNPQILNLEDVVIQAVVVFKPACEKKKINISHNVPHDINIFADENMLETILRNLISNAVKFTKENGSINITATELVRFVELSVTDTGVGMSKEDINDALNISKHHTTLGTNQEKGTGLGLIMIKEFAEKHNGRLTITSKIGKGTTIKVLLPKDRYFITPHK